MKLSSDLHMCAIACKWPCMCARAHIHTRRRVGENEGRRGDRRGKEEERSKDTT